MRKSLRIVFVLFLLCAMAVPAFAEFLYCSKCGIVLTGKYYRTKSGSYLCPSCCKNSRLYCSSCGREINGTYYKTANGDILCPDDHLNQIPRCSVCKTMLTGKYYRLKNGKCVCEHDYYASLPSCSICGKKLTGHYYSDNNDRNYCEEDYYAQIPVCAICGIKLNKIKYKHYSNDEFICIKCDNAYARCLVCNCPTDYRGMQLSDGRVICPVHKRHAVLGRNNGTIIYDKAVNNIVSMFGDVMELKFPVSSVMLVDKDELRKLKQGELGQGIGLCHTSKIGNKFNHRIWALEGYPPEQLLTTMAHEYAHAWQNENNPNFGELAPAFKEGFAHWVAYKMNEYLHRSSEMKRLMMYDDDVYGFGLKAFINLEHDIGVNGVLWAAKTQLNF